MDNEARTWAYGAQLEHCGPIRKRSSLTPFCHTQTFSPFKMQELAPPVLMLEAPFVIGQAAGDPSLLACESVRLDYDAT
jgi:hypothetical protein